MAKSYTVLSQQTIKSAAIDRAGKDDVLVVYTTDDGHTDTVTIPAEAFNEQALTDAVRRKETDRSTIVGRTVEL